MIKIPSYKAAAIFGAIGIPVFIYVLNVLENRSAHQIALIIWSIIGFGLPLLISTGDLNYVMKKGRPFFRSWTRPQDFKEFFIPAWKKMFVWFFGSVNLSATA